MGYDTSGNYYIKNLRNFKNKLQGKIGLDFR